MSSYLKSFFKQHLETCFVGVDEENIDFENMHTMVMKNLKLRDDRVSIFNEFSCSQSPLELTSVSIGQLELKMPEYGKVTMNAEGVTLSFNFTPVRSMLSAYDGGAEAVPGFAHKMEDIRSSAHWEKLLNAYDNSQPVQTADVETPRFCNPHRNPKNRIRDNARMVNCKLCDARVQTNYKFCALCPTCSAQQGKCLICGSRRVVETPEQELARVVRDIGPYDSDANEYDTPSIGFFPGFVPQEEKLSQGFQDDDHVMPIMPPSSASSASSRPNQTRRLGGDQDGGPVAEQWPAASHSEDRRSSLLPPERSLQREQLQVIGDSDVPDSDWAHLVSSGSPRVPQREQRAAARTRTPDRQAARPHGMMNPRLARPVNRGQPASVTGDQPLHMK